MKSTNLSKIFLDRELSEIEFLIRDSSDPDLYSVLYNKFFYLIDRIPFAVSRKKPGNVIFRCRQNLNGEIFKNDKQITYPPKEYITEYGRANFPHESVFYGCIPSHVNKHETSIDAYNACILESDKELFTDIRDDFKKIYTVGKWDTSESQSNFVYLPFSHKAFLKSEMIQDIVRLFKEFAYQFYSKEEIEEIIIPFHKYVSFKFSASKNNKNDYILTNAFKNALLNCYNFQGTKLDGIIYSSSTTDCSSINVALTADFADKFLKLDQILMRSCNGVDKHRSIDTLTDIINVNDMGEFNVVFIKK